MQFDDDLCSHLGRESSRGKTESSSGPIRSAGRSDRRVPGPEKRLLIPYHRYVGDMTVETILVYSFWSSRSRTPT